MLVTGVAGDQAAQLVAAIALATGRALPGARAAANGLDRELPLQGRRHGLPGRSRRRRGRRGAAEAHRHVRRRRQRVARDRVLAGLARRDALDDGARRRRLARRRSSGCAGSRPRSRARWCSSPAGCWPRRSSTSTRTGSPSSATSRADFPAPSFPTPASSATIIGVIAIAAVALLLIGFSQTAGDARAFAARHRYRIDVNQESVGAGDGEHRRRRVPGHAGLDEPLGQLAERGRRGADARRLARDRGSRAGHPARPRAAVLGAAQGGARGRDHRRRRVRHDRRARDPPPATRGAVRLLDRRSRRSSASSRPACWPVS